MLDSLDRFYQQVCETTLRETFSKKEIRTNLHMLLGNFRHDFSHHRVKKIEEVALADYKREKFLLWFDNEPLAVPVYILTPKKPKREMMPGVMALHGHGYGVCEIVGLTRVGKEDELFNGSHRHFAVSLVKQGMKVIAPEIIGYGERMLTIDKKGDKKNSCYKLATAFLMKGQTLAGYRIAETAKVMRWFSAHYQVDERQLGIMGFSGGALIAGYLAVIESYIKATVLTGFTNTFKQSILAREHCLDNYIPGILTIGELPKLLAALCPRYLHVEAGIKDHLFPEKGVKRAVSYLTQIYEKERVGNNFTSHFFDGGHEVCGEKAFTWLSDVLMRE
ncbi:dienelactone hydrolase [Salipaludibacillus agaradhaerens]|uniref:S9 family peptidase n=1 Tax=Salipaludibacillus agaradhaerens TaxID=76935 RepID=UPI0021512AD8|nr:S9 family peptidase [Salipaludibacillus agaradhaerens]MCR6107763.1 dienelactone hydrolase [Salipaludibacillus agaradhaerens]MCR6119792.1 dienelactone hydrolase [Salipaludibacillus agaradhaerens]UJW58849.1 dienelactone hydrolase [Bacillus sp. A116_S68]